MEGRANGVGMWIYREGFAEREECVATLGEVIVGGMVGVSIRRCAI
jgi:hypothetical protein